MKDTNKVSSIMIEGATKKVKTLLEKRDSMGLFLCGRFEYRDRHNDYEIPPFGIPKVMLSSTAPCLLMLEDTSAPKISP